jgi:hypothetical protein
MTTTAEGERPCRNCNGEQWVCEDHLDTPWAGGDGCCGGAGAPCPVCCPLMANAALVSYLGIMLGEDERFQVAIGGNPNAIDKKLDEMRRVYARYTGDQHD